MRYLLMIYGDDEDWMQRPAEDLEPAFEEFAAFGVDLRRVNAYVVDEALRPTSTSITIQVREDSEEITHGPCLDSPKQLSGFYLIDVDSHEQAIEWGKRLSRISGEAVEVRPAIEF